MKENGEISELFSICCRYFWNERILFVRRNASFQSIFKAADQQNTQKLDYKCVDQTLRADDYKSQKNMEDVRTT